LMKKIDQYIKKIPFNKVELHNFGENLDN